MLLPHPTFSLSDKSTEEVKQVYSFNISVFFCFLGSKQKLCLFTLVDII